MDALAARPNWTVSARRVAALALSYLPAIAAIIVTEHTEGPISLWFGITGAILLITAVCFTVAAALGSFPYPDSLRSWAALCNEFLGEAIFILTIPGHLLFNYSLVAAGLVLKRIHLRLALKSLPGWTLWRAIFRLITGRLSKAISLHRALAVEKGEISLSTARALFRLHHRLVLKRYLQLLHTYDLEENKLRVKEMECHARFALFYRRLFRLPPFRYRSLLEMYFVLARVYLSTSLDTTRSDRAAFQEAGFAALADAGQARWFSVEGLRPRLYMAERQHLAQLREAVEYPEFQEESRFPTLLEMLENGTTPERLAEIRSEIHAPPDDTLMTSQERQERQWAEALAGASVEHTRPWSFPSGNDPACLSEIRGWNWGAFFLSWIWAFGNRLTGLGVLGLVLSLSFPLIGHLAIAIYLGIDGNELAWKTRHFRSVEEFRATQRAWKRWGVAVFIFIILLIPLMTILWFIAAAAFLLLFDLLLQAA